MSFRIDGLGIYEADQESAMKAVGMLERQPALSFSQLTVRRARAPQSLTSDDRLAAGLFIMQKYSANKWMFKAQVCNPHLRACSSDRGCITLHSPM